MWERIRQSEVVVRRNILPARVVLDRDAECGEYRTYLEIIPKDCGPTFLNVRIFTDPELALEDFERRWVKTIELLTLGVTLQPWEPRTLLNI